MGEAAVRAVEGRPQERQLLLRAETLEREQLRREYIDAVVGSLKGELENTYVVDEKGRKSKLRRKGEQ